MSDIVCSLHDGIVHYDTLVLRMNIGTPEFCCRKIAAVTKMSALPLDHFISGEPPIFRLQNYQLLQCCLTESWRDTAFDLRCCWLLLHLQPLPATSKIGTENAGFYKDNLVIFVPPYIVLVFGILYQSFYQ